MRSYGRWVRFIVIVALGIWGPSPAALALEAPPPPVTTPAPIVAGPITPTLNASVETPFIARLGQALPAWLEVSNVGGATTGTVYLTATMPLDVAFVSAAGTGWACGGVTAGDEGGTLLCQRSSLAAGETATVTVKLEAVTVPGVVGEIGVQAATAGSPPESPNTSEISAGAHSANNNPWDVYDGLLYPGYDVTGAVDDGGQDAFDEFGLLRLRVYDLGGNLDTATGNLAGFGLVYQPGHRWETTSVVEADVISVTRRLYAPAHADWLRYVDSFTNFGVVTRTVWVAWGGDLGSDSNTELVTTSSGDAALTGADTWAVTRASVVGVTNDPPVAYILRSPADTTYQGPGIFDSDPFTATWPTTGTDEIGHIFRLSIAPGATARLAYFLYRGLSESDLAPQDCEYYDDCQPVPAANSEVTLAETRAAELAEGPYFCDLAPEVLAQIVNWPGAVMACSVYLPLAQR